MLARINRGARFQFIAADLLGLALLLPLLGVGYRLRLRLLSEQCLAAVVPSTGPNPVRGAEQQRGGDRDRDHRRGTACPLLPNAADQPFQ